MKHLFAKWLAALLIAALLLTPVAMMEEAPAAEPVAVEAAEVVNADETPAEPDAAPEDDAAPAEPADELIVAEAFEAAPTEAEDLELNQSDEDIDDPREADGMDLTEDEAELGINFAANADGSVTINKTNFPDDYFRAYIADLLGKNEGDTISFWGEGGLMATRTIDLSTWPDKDKITILEGLNYFIVLQELNISGCTGLTNLSHAEYDANGNFSRELMPGGIEKLNASNCTNLKILQYGESNLSELNVTGCTNLEELGCNYDRNLTSLDVSTCKNLKRLYIGWTKLTAVPKLANNDLLEELNCSELGLTALNPGDYPNLNILSCGGNGLSQLDISGCATLTTLDCWGNTFSELNLSNNKKLAELWCEGNPNLKTLDISNCEVLNAAVDPNAPKDVDYDNDGNPDCVGYGPYVDEYNNNGWRLTCDKGVTITKKKAEDPTPPPANVSQPSSGTAASNEPQITIAKNPKSTKAKAGKKGRVTVTWKKIKKTKKTKALLGQIKSVQVQYSTDPNFAANVVTKSVSKKKTKVTLKLQKKTTYYIRVRYVGADGVSNWGAVKKVRTKK